VKKPNIGYIAGALAGLFFSGAALTIITIELFKELTPIFGIIFSVFSASLMIAMIVSIIALIRVLYYDHH